MMKLRNYSQLLSWALLTTGAVGAVVRRAHCDDNNCLGARNNHATSASSFCSSFLATSVPATLTSIVPTYLAKCGPSNLIPNLSSACPCFLATFTSSGSQGSAKTTSTSKTSSICTSQQVITKIISVSTCSTAAPVTITPPASTYTVTSTTTTTATSYSAVYPNCFDPVQNGGFEAFPGWQGEYPWFGPGDLDDQGFTLGIANTPTPASGSPFPLPPEGVFSGTQCFYAQAQNVPLYYPVSMSQGINVCYDNVHGPIIWMNTAGSEGVTFTITFKVHVEGGTDWFSTTTVDGSNSGWQEITADPWDNPYSQFILPATFNFSITANSADYTYWLDAIQFEAIT